MRDVEELVDLFRARGLRITAQRQQIFRVLAQKDNHPTAEAVWAAVREEQPAISLKTVYETLHELVEIGEIQQVNLEQGASRFDRNVSAHHHLICRVCSQMVDIDCAVGEGPCLTTPDDSGYEIDKAEVIYWGRCPECASAASSSSGDIRRPRRGTTASGRQSHRSSATRSRATNKKKEAVREENERV